jgi:thiol-disulfide isomerase/thioredoxin
MPASFRRLIVALLWLSSASSVLTAQFVAEDPPKPGEPTEIKARKTFANAIAWAKNRDYGAAMEDYLKANRQDGGHCWECVNRAFNLAIRIEAWKDADAAARQALAAATTPEQAGTAHFFLASAMQREGLAGGNAKYFADSCDEFKAALATRPDMTAAHYSYGVSLAHIHRDEEARHEFGQFLDEDKKQPALHDRAERYIENMELARARMVPPFSLVTLDGQRITMDGLAGKVVLVDFWATWCAPCREALPHIRSIAKKFKDQPLVIISVSLDVDDAKWKAYVEKNEMTWMQYRENGFNGRLAKQFNVTAIPATYTADADGILEDQHVGDASIEGKIKKLVARAAEMPARKPLQTASEKPAADPN